MSFQPGAFQATGFQFGKTQFTVDSPQDSLGFMPKEYFIFLGQKHAHTVQNQDLGRPSAGGIALDGGNPPGHIEMAASYTISRWAHDQLAVGQSHAIGTSAQSLGSPTHDDVIVISPHNLSTEPEFTLDIEQESLIFLGGESNLFLLEQVMRLLHGEIRVSQPRPGPVLPEVPVSQPQSIVNYHRQLAAIRYPALYGEEYGIDEDRSRTIYEVTRSKT